MLTSSSTWISFQVMGKMFSTWVCKGKKVHTHSIPQQSYPLAWGAWGSEEKELDKEPQDLVEASTLSLPGHQS